MDEEEQYDLWRREYANHCLGAAHAAEQMRFYAPDEANPEWFASRIGFHQQEADEVWPDEHSWPKDPKTAEIYDFLTRQKVNT